MAAAYVFSCTPINTRSCSLCRSTSTGNKFKSSSFRTWRIGQPPLIRAIRAAGGPNPPEPTSPLQDDFTYVLKLAGGSILGASVIKYGSAIIPDITRPNLTLALLMISTPVVVAALLLFVGSRKE